MTINTVTNRLYIKGCLEAVSPLIIGSGEDEHTNIDVIRDGSGLPFIPGTSLAGSLRHYLNENLKGKNGESGIVLSLFGRKEKDSTQSLIMISDAVPIGSEVPKVTVRDGLELCHITKTVTERKKNDKNRSGTKYDYEIVEPGTCFELKIEINIRQNSKDDIYSAVTFIVKSLQDGHIRLGAKTRRGFGKLLLKDTEIMELDMTHSPDVDRWIDFDWNFQGNRTSDEINKHPINHKKNHVKITFPFSIPYSLLIRHYSANPAEDDTSHLTAGGKPVIPGTSWNGALLHAMHRILDHLDRKERFCEIKNDLFGYVGENNDDTQASRIFIEESIIEKTKSISYTRNKVDRFTGGVVDSALFSEKPVYGGAVTLALFIKAPKGWEIGLLLLALKDMAKGIQPVGGAANIGRGILSGDSTDINIDDEFLTPEKEDIYFKVLHAYITTGGKNDR